MEKTKGKTKKRVKQVRAAKKVKKTKKFKPIKIAALILSAINDLSESKGSTPNKISGYISYASNLPEYQVKRQVNTALKRGVEFGVLRRYRGHYFLPTGDELDRANRIALRFARLPSPAPSNFLSSLDDDSAAVIESAADVKSARSRKSISPLEKRKKKSARSLHVSPARSFSDLSSNQDDSPISSDVD